MNVKISNPREISDLNSSGKKKQKEKWLAECCRIKGVKSVTFLKAAFLVFSH
jgi:hypothetical protein